MPENPINNILITFTFNGGSVGGDDYDYYYHWITKRKKNNNSSVGRSIDFKRAAH